MTVCSSCGIVGPEKNRNSAGRNTKPNVSADLGNPTVSQLKQNPVFREAVIKMVNQYPGLSEDAVYNLIELVNRKSCKFTSQERTGVFGIEIRRLNEIGYTSSEIQSMSYVQQLQVYQHYLDHWNYTGGSLWIMHVAPEFANMSENTEVYARHTAKWVQCSSMRNSEGKITVQSVNDYYERKVNQR